MVQHTKVTIIGAGPAGLAAAMYLQRAQVQPMILEKGTPGGLIRNAYCVENYPGFPGGITGTTLADLFVEQCHRLGLSIVKSTVTLVGYHNNKYIIETDHGRLFSSAIIIATGTVPKTIEIKGSSSVDGVRLFYELKSLLLKEKKTKKRIIVIGGGDIAFDYALTLLNLGHVVTIVSRSKPSCLPLLQKRALQNGVTIRTERAVKEIIKRRSDILLKCQYNNEVEEFFTDFILIACGREPNASFLAPNLKKCINDVTACSQTSYPGLFLAGDVIRGTYRQTGIAVGDGIHAAMLVERFLRNKTVE